MGRGGGVVAGSKHSVQNEKHHSSGGGKGDPFCTGIFCIIAAVVFLILAIAIPVAMVINPSGDKCPGAESVKDLNRNEQAVCVPDDLDTKWVAEFDSVGAQTTKVYKVDNTTLHTTYRTYYWHNYQADLKGTYDYFAMSVPLGLEGYIEVYCDGSKCDHLRMYYLDSKQFDASVDSNGEFNEKTYRYDFKDFRDGDWNTFLFNATGPDTFYLVFSNNKNKHVEITYNIFMKYAVYDMSGHTAEKCEGNKCVFENMKKNEIIVMDFISSTDAAWADKAGTEPQSYHVNLHNTKMHLGAVIAVAVVFVILTIIAALLGVLFLVRIL